MGNLYNSIQALQQRLADAGVPSIVIGGVAVGVWGEPRLTRDADLKVLLERKDADRLLSILQADYISLLAAPQEAIKRQGMLFVQDADGTRLDLLLADTDFELPASATQRETIILPYVLELNRRNTGDCQRSAAKVPYGNRSK